ncbi:MAG: HNH endonuclease [Eubacteriales bacterium]
MTESFYKSKRWKKKRLAILKRDGYMCIECRKYGRRRDATTVHHIKDLEHHPELAFVDSNLVSLCDACHNKMHPEKGGSWGRKHE